MNALQRLRQRLMQELTADGIHHDDWPDAEIPVADVFSLIEEVEKELTKDGEK